MGGGGKGGAGVFSRGAGEGIVASFSGNLKALRRPPCQWQIPDLFLWSFKKTMAFKMAETPGD